MFLFPMTVCFCLFPFCFFVPDTRVGEVARGAHISGLVGGYLLWTRPPARLTPPSCWQLRWRDGAMAANLHLRAGSPPLRTVWVTSLGGWGTWCGGAGRGWVVGVGCGGVGDGASVPTITATHTRFCSPFLFSSLGLISLLFGQECAERLGTAPCYYGTVTAWSSKSGVRNEPERRQRWGELTPPALVLAGQAEVWVGPESLPVGLPCLSFLSEPSSPNILLSEQKIWKSLKNTKNSPPPARAA